MQGTQINGSKKIPSGLCLGWQSHPIKILADEIKIGSIKEFYFEINVEIQLRFDLSNSLKTIVAFYTSLGMLTTNEISAAWAFHCCFLVFLSATLNTPASLSFSLMAHLNARCTCRACVTKKRQYKKNCHRWCRNESFWNMSMKLLIPYIHEKLESESISFSLRCPSQTTEFDCQICGI